MIKTLRHALGREIAEQHILAQTHQHIAVTFPQLREHAAMRRAFVIELHDGSYRRATISAYAGVIEILEWDRFPSLFSPLS